MNDLFRIQNHKMFWLDLEHSEDHNTQWCDLYHKHSKNCKGLVSVQNIGQISTKNAHNHFMINHWNFAMKVYLGLGASWDKNFQLCGMKVTGWSTAHAKVVEGVFKVAFIKFQHLLPAEVWWNDNHTFAYEECNLLGGENPIKSFLLLKTPTSELPSLTLKVLLM